MLASSAPVVNDGVRWPTPLSFAHSFVRYASDERLRVTRERWELDAGGRGLASYRAVLAGQTFTFIVGSHLIEGGGREDRIIATEWDATSALVVGDADEEDYASVFTQVPNVLWGRATRRTVVWSRSNRSMTLFEHVVGRLASGQQPDLDLLASVGYLLRTTGFSANGRNGMLDYGALLAFGNPLRGAYHAQMLAGYLWREFSVDLVDHLARSEDSVQLAPDIHRYLGIGNSSGIGLAPFIVRHPVLVDHWSAQVEDASDAARLLPLDGTSAADGNRSQLRILITEAITHFREQPAGTYEHFAPGARIADGLERALRQLDAGASTIGEFLDLLQDELDAEVIEALKSLSIQIGFDGRNAGALDLMTVDESLDYRPEETCGSLRRRLRASFEWALGLDLGHVREHYFWYYSEEHMEPRRGISGEDPGEDYSIPLDVLGRLQQLDQALAEVESTAPVAVLVMREPDLHYIVSWVQTMAGRRYALRSSDFLSLDFVPLDIMRFQLAIYGMLKMRPVSQNWLRGTILQGAPLRDELVPGRLLPIFPCAPRSHDA